MKAIVVHEFGGPEVLKFEEISTPKPAAGQVLSARSRGWSKSLRHLHAQRHIRR